MFFLLVMYFRSDITLEEYNEFIRVTDEIAYKSYLKDCKMEYENSLSYRIKSDLALGSIVITAAIIMFAGAFGLVKLISKPINYFLNLNQDKIQVVPSDTLNSKMPELLKGLESIE